MSLKLILLIQILFACCSAEDVPEIHQLIIHVPEINDYQATALIYYKAPLIFSDRKPHNYFVKHLKEDHNYQREFSGHSNTFQNESSEDVKSKIQRRTQTHFLYLVFPLVFAILIIYKKCRGRYQKKETIISDAQEETILQK